MARTLLSRWMSTPISFQKRFARIYGASNSLSQLLQHKVVTWPIRTSLAAVGVQFIAENGGGAGVTARSSKKRRWESDRGATRGVDA
jgi:hypothetical protein